MSESSKYLLIHLKTMVTSFFHVNIYTFMKINYILPNTNKFSEKSNINLHLYTSSVFDLIEDRFSHLPSADWISCNFMYHAIYTRMPCEEREMEDDGKRREKAMQGSRQRSAWFIYMPRTTEDDWSTTRSKTWNTCL